MPLTDNLWGFLNPDKTPRIVEGKVTVHIGRFNQFAMVMTPHPGRDGGPGAVTAEIVNKQTEKVRIKFTLHAWWLRVFVFDLAQAVALIEREFDTLPPEYVEMMEAQEREAAS